MRSRNIKPGFFKNDILASCKPITRLLFIGLWMIADREGRIEKRPLRIKAEIFPYENSLDIHRELTVIERLGFIQTYTFEGQEYLQVLNFKIHQNPHHTEAKSKLPDISDGCIVTVNSPLNNGEYPADSLIPDSLIQEDILIRVPRKKSLSYSEPFEQFWASYPRKVEKPKAFAAWKEQRINGELPTIISQVEAYKMTHDWKKDNGKWIPYPERFIKRRKWEDEIPEVKEVDYSEFSPS